MVNIMQGVPYTPEETEALKKEIIDYFLSTPGGTFANACKKAKLHFSTAYDWRKADPEFEKAVVEARKVADNLGGDVAETALMNAIIKNNMTGIIFYLKTKHKDRGYVERSEVSGPGGVPFHSESHGQSTIEEEQAVLDDLIAAGKAPPA